MNKKILGIRGFIYKVKNEFEIVSRLCLFCPVAVCCSVFQCVAVCCSVLQCVAVCCSKLTNEFERVSRVYLHCAVSHQYISCALVC